MNAITVTSVSNRRRVRRARAWLESRTADEEVIIVAATLDAANELARQVAQGKGAAFGWHRLSFSQLAVVTAAPVLGAHGLVALSRIGRKRLSPD